MRIGLVSDTHGIFDERLPALLAGVAVILHAGDVGSEAVLRQLELIAPTRAVRGNVDPAALALPRSLSFEADGTAIEVKHILPASRAQLQAWCEADSQTRERDRFLAAFRPATRVIVFGHSHQPGIYLLQRLLLVNPGSAGRKRFSLPRSCAVMEVSGVGVEVKICSLEDYNELMRRSIPIGQGGFASCSH